MSPIYLKSLLQTKTRATVWPYNPTLMHISREKRGPKGHTRHNVQSSTIYNSQDMKATLGFPGG